MIGHVDRTISDHGRLSRLAETGCVPEHDPFGDEHAGWTFAPINIPGEGTPIAVIGALRIGTGRARAPRCAGRSGCQGTSPLAR
jgi:hypothetical protein